MKRFLILFSLLFSLNSIFALSLNDDDLKQYNNIIESSRKTNTSVEKLKQLVITLPVDKLKLYVGETEITQELYEYVTGQNPSKIKGKNLPVTNIKYIEAVAFCNALSEKLGFEQCYVIISEQIICCENRNGYRLPYLDEFNEYYKENSGFYFKNYDTNLWTCKRLLDDWNVRKIEHPLNEPFPVKTSKKDDNGLYDIFGNVKEWTNASWRDTKVVGMGYNDGDDVNNLKQTNYIDMPEDDVGFRIVLTNQSFKKEIVNRSLEKMIMINSGEYINEKNQNVTVSDFYIMDTYLPKKDYVFFRDELYWAGEWSTWTNIVILCNQMSNIAGLTPCYSINGNTDVSEWNIANKYKYITCDYYADGFRLPTIAEWEYYLKEKKLEESESLKLEALVWDFGNSYNDLSAIKADKNKTIEKELLNPTNFDGLNYFTSEKGKLKIGNKPNQQIENAADGIKDCVRLVRSANIEKRKEQEASFAERIKNQKEQERIEKERIAAEKKAKEEKLAKAREEEEKLREEKEKKLKEERFLEYEKHRKDERKNGIVVDFRDIGDYISKYNSSFKGKVTIIGKGDFDLSSWYSINNIISYTPKNQKTELIIDLSGIKYDDEFSKNVSNDKKTSLRVMIRTLNEMENKTILSEIYFPANIYSFMLYGSGSNIHNSIVKQK